MTGGKRHPDAVLSRLFSTWEATVFSLGLTDYGQEIDDKTLGIIAALLTVADEIYALREGS